jgi:hypothetical protein
MRFAIVLLGLGVSLAGLVHCDPATSTTPDDGGVASTCVAPTGPVIEHSATITADETWGAENVHFVKFGFSIKKGATLTIAPCATVQLGAGYSITADGGNLVARGTPSQPIRFVAADPGQPWGAIVVFAPGTVKLAYATLSDLGATSGYGALEARGDQLLPAQEILDVDHVTVKNAQNHAVSLREGGAFTKTSQALTLTGGTKSPVRAAPRLLGNLPTGNYTGNAVDEITIGPEAYGDVNWEDVVFHDRGVPYGVGDPNSSARFWIGPKRYTLTIEPGVKLAFRANGVIATKADQGTTGVLVAKGTAEKPIVFTSASPTPTAGDWQGIVFSEAADPANALDHVEVRYAGGPSGANGFHCDPDGGFGKSEDALVTIFAEPGAPFITNSVLSNSKGAGINLAYTGAVVDMKPTNTFELLNGCKLTRPRPKTGQCPVLPCDG